MKLRMMMLLKSMMKKRENNINHCHYTRDWSITETVEGFEESQDAGLKSYRKAWKAGESDVAFLDKKLEPILSSCTPPFKGMPNWSMLRTISPKFSKGWKWNEQWAKKKFHFQSISRIFFGSQWKENEVNSLITTDVVFNEILLLKFPNTTVLDEKGKKRNMRAKYNVR